MNNMNMFIEKSVLYLLLFQFTLLSANRYGSFCYSDSDCDQHQKCSSNRLCQCNLNERRFWTGTRCAICATGYLITNDRCYKYFSELKTWEASRAHCRAQYADLFTWRDNHDEQFIRPIIQSWAVSQLFLQVWSHVAYIAPRQPYTAWAGANVSSFQPIRVKWMDPAGMRLDVNSKEWCDPTKDAGYGLGKEPTSSTKTGQNGTEREACITYNFGGAGTSFLCLSDDYCSQKYPFICEMNAVSMALATATHHGQDANTNDDEEYVMGKDEPDLDDTPAPPPEELNLGPGSTQQVTNLSKDTGFLSTKNIIIIGVVASIVVVAVIAGIIIFKNKKKSGKYRARDRASASQGRPSVASSVGSMAD